MTGQSEFYRALTKTVLVNLGCSYGEDNWDAARFGPLRPGSASRRRAFLDSALSSLAPFLQQHGYAVIPADTLASEFDAMMESYGEGLCNTYGMLADDYSKRALVEVLAFRLLGYRRMKLWTNTPEYWRVRAIVESLPRDGEPIDPGMNVLQPLAKTDLNPIGYPITMFTAPAVVEGQFLRTDYAYSHCDPPIWLRDGDFVIDAGAAWGDTALRFAHEVGESGRVFSFEFEPGNLSILERNLALNPTLSSRVVVVPKALWSDSATTLGFVSGGPGSRVCEMTTKLQNGQVECVAIDDYAHSLPKIDFIKMDIEGAELPALHGAEQTIRRHRPKLAICVYHRLSDFVDIPAYLASLELEYDFYLDHSTIYDEETVLFASPRTVSNTTSLT